MWCILILLEFAVNLRRSFFDPPAGGENQALLTAKQQALLIFLNYLLELQIIAIWEYN